VIGDHFRLSQILNNLIGNSIKFTEQGSITVETLGLPIQNNQQIIRFSIKDTGIGIDKERQSHLFHPFIQGDNTITRRYGGTGLGLSICKKLVQIMHGQIGMESEPGQGSTFWFEIPYQVGEQHQIQSVHTRAVPNQNLPIEQNLKGYHVLVVDDNEMNRIMLTRLLSQEGATSATCENGKAALDLIQAHPTVFDVVMMDVQMPVMDGLTATQMIRHTLGLHQLPILVCSAGVYTQEQSRAMLAGADDFVPKPIQREVMLKKIKSVVPIPHSATPLSTAEATTDDPNNATAAATSIWLDIPGIDTTALRAELGNDPDFFLSMLQMFAQNLQTVINELPTHLQTPAAGTAMLHKLRGAAGSIGAYGLAEHSQELETAIQHADPQRFALSEHFLRQANTLLQSIRSAIEAQNGKTPTL
jgi:CheY-like chemotaxis protein